LHQFRAYLRVPGKVFARSWMERSMNEHDDDLESTVVEGEEVERDAFNVDEEPLGRVEEEPAADEDSPDDDAPTIDDAEL
jgi:hypothetical protein